MSITVEENNLVVKIAETNTVVRVEKGLIGPQGIQGDGFPIGGTTNQVLRKISGDDFDTEWASVGSGDVSGPGSSVADNLVSFDGVTGTIIKDSGILSTDVSTNITNTNTHIATSDIHIKCVNSVNAPTVDNDNTEGYTLNSLWVKTSANGEIAYICTDDTTGAAMWCIICGEGVDATDVTLHGKVDIATGSVKGYAAFISGGSGEYKAEFQFGDRSGHNSSHISGLFAETKGDNQDVEIVTKGKLIGSTGAPLDTSSWAVGTRLHLSTNGQLIGESVGGGGSHIEVGRVLRQHAIEGVIEVDVAKYVHAIRAWLGGNLELAVGSNDLTTWISLEHFDGTVFGKIWIDGIVVPNIQRMIFTGHIDWTGSGNYYDPTFPDGEFRLLRGGSGEIRSELINFTAPQDTGVLSADQAYWIYIDSSGDIQSTTSRPDSLFEDNIVLFQVLYDGTNYLVTKENHPSCFNQCVSNELHRAYNAVVSNGGADIVRVATGTGASADDRRLKIVGADVLLDHGLNTTIPDSSGVGVTINHQYTNGSTNWNRDSLDSEFPMKYNNAGTPTAITINRYGVFRVYVSKDDLNTSTPIYVSVMHTAEFTSIALARTAIDSGVAEATGDLATLEMAQLGYVIVRNNASGGYLAEVQIQKQTLRETITGAPLIAALVGVDTTNFSNTLGVGDTNVQNALETLDDHTISSHSDTTATGTELETLTNGSNASSLHTHNAATTTLAGISELATVAEIDSGTDTGRAITPDGLAGSIFGTEAIGLAPVPSDTAVAIGDGTVGILITSKHNGMDIVDVIAAVYDKGITGTTDIQIRRRRAGSNVDVLSTKVTIGDEWYASDGVINTSNDDLQTGDLIYVDRDAIHSGTAPNGLTVVILVRKP